MYPPSPLNFQVFSVLNLLIKREEVIIIQISYFHSPQEEQKTIESIVLKIFSRSLGFGTKGEIIFLNNCETLKTTNRYIQSSLCYIRKMVCYSTFFWLNTPSILKEQKLFHINWDETYIYYACEISYFNKIKKYVNWFQ